MFFKTSLGPPKQDEPIATALIASGFGNTTSAPLGGRLYKKELLTASLLAEINRFPKSHRITTEEWLQLTTEKPEFMELGTPRKYHMAIKKIEMASEKFKINDKEKTKKNDSEGILHLETVCQE